MMDDTPDNNKNSDAVKAYSQMLFKYNNTCSKNNNNIIQIIHWLPRNLFKYNNTGNNNII